MKTKASVWIMLLVTAVVAIGCDKDDDDDWGGGNGGNIEIEGALSGVFSVSAMEKVNFSQGNLQYRASDNSWRFAENQRDYIGGDNSQISSTYDGWIDLFGWGTSGYDQGAICYQPWSTSTNNSDYYAYGQSNCNLNDRTGKADWGYNAISNGGNQLNLWRTLTKAEWKYVINDRITSSGIRYAKARVQGDNGLILLPDDWNASYYTLNRTNQEGAPFSSNIINSLQWNTIEGLGAVFLPTAGDRYGTLVEEIGEVGSYYSTTYEDNNGVYSLGFYDEELDVDEAEYRCYGYSVRLVCTARSGSSIHIPSVTTSDITEISSISAKGGGTVTSDGGATVTERGVCWSTSHNPTINGEHQNAFDGGTGSFTCRIIGLTESTTYYVRAYATNSVGTGYGEEVTFFTTEGGGGGGTSAPIVSIHQEDGYIANNDVLYVDTEYRFGFDMSSNSGLASLFIQVDDNELDSVILYGTDTYSYSSLIKYEISKAIIGESVIKATVTDLNGQSNSAEIRVQIDDNNGNGNNVVPEGAISGLFSVSATQKVYFSQGNLQYQASTNTWRFAEKQWDFVGIGNNNISSTYSGWIDLFCWGTSGWNCGNTYYQPWDWDAINTNGFLFGPSGSYNLNENYANSDWGIYNVINNGGSTTGQWRTLTYDEWYYILNTRSGLRYAKATVNGVRGVVLFPDGWNNYTPSYANHYEVDFSWNSYSSVQWDLMEQQGAVFICAAGQRLGNSIKYNGVRGYYWSSSHSGTHGAKGLYFSHEALGAGSGFIRCNGASVRLVSNAQ